jgi:S-methylmethionine-dependent homocysteine/selenocysteine methylase
MGPYRKALPQLDGDIWLTDGGIETTLIYHDGLDLPDFAAFHLLRTTEGVEALERYFRSYADVAWRHGRDLVLESATWRASRDWGERLGYTRAELAAANRRAVRLLEEVRSDYEPDGMRVVVSGCVGPRGDGYVPTGAMSAAAARAYHAAQVEAFADTAADLVTAITMNYTDEAIGIALAGRDAAMPVVVSFTVETNGRLPTGEALGDAVQRVDDETAGYPAYYMINCAHPSHFSGVLAAAGSWVERIRGIRANASCLSHAELNEATTLDMGDPEALARDYAALVERLPWISVVGGCCGTDHRHIERIAADIMEIKAGVEA